MAIIYCYASAISVGGGLGNALEKVVGHQVARFTVWGLHFVFSASRLPSGVSVTGLVGCDGMLVSVSALGCERL